MSLAAEHAVDVAQGVEPKTIEWLRMNFDGAFSEVGMYIVMERVS